jgi:hypothetical protein
MDVDKALRDLYEEKHRLDIAIAALEGHLRTAAERPALARRGRKSMTPEERQQVSARMSKYWEARRAASPAVQDESESESAKSATAATDGVSA